MKTNLYIVHSTTGKSFGIVAESVGRAVSIFSRKNPRLTMHSVKRDNKILATAQSSLML